MMILIKVALRNTKVNIKWALMTVSGISLSVMLVATVIMFGQGAYEKSKTEFLNSNGYWNVLVAAESNQVPQSDYVIESFVRTNDWLIYTSV